MYLGTVEQIQTCYRDKWIQGIGTISARCGAEKQMMHSYRCETCNRTLSLRQQAEEDFYCRCGALIRTA